MTVKEIAESEKENRGSIILRREGMFLRAYERSAMLFVENVANFQLQKKYFKSLDGELVYLGFPAQNLRILLEKAGIEREYNADAFETGLLCYRMALDGKKELAVNVKETIEKIRLRLRLLLTLGEISIKAFSRVNIQMEYLYKQVT